MTYRVEQVLETIETNNNVSDDTESTSTTSSHQNVVNDAYQQQSNMDSPRHRLDTSRSSNASTPRSQDTAPPQSARSVTLSEPEVQPANQSRDIPTWAKHGQHMHHHLAECSGCIAEQDIRHTCGSHEEKCTHSSHETPPPPHSHNHPQPHINSPPSQHAPPPTSAPHIPRTGRTLPTQPHYPPPPHSMPYQQHMDYRSTGYPPQQPAHAQPQNGVDAPNSSDEVVDKDGGYVYASSSSHTSSTHSSYASSQQYSYDHPPPPNMTSHASSASGHDTAQSQMKRSKSAHFDYELPQQQPHNYGPYGPSDPYHYSRVYPHPPAGYPPNTFHPPHHQPPPHPQGYYPPPGGHPGYPPYDGRVFAPPPPGKPAGCQTCAALLAQYGYIPDEHLHDHKLRQAQSPEEYRDFPGVPPPVSSQQHMQHQGVPNRYPPSDVTSGPAGHAHLHQAHANKMPLHQNHLSPRSDISGSVDTDMTSPRSAPNTQAHLPRRLPTSPGDYTRENDVNDNDLTSDLDLSAFSGSKHQTDDAASVFRAPNHSTPIKGDQQPGGDDNNSVTNDNTSHSNSFGNPPSLRSSRNTGNTDNMPESSSSSTKTRDLFARLDQKAASVAGLQQQTSSTTITVNAVQNTSSQLPVTAMQSEQHQGSLLENAGLAASTHSTTSIDENIPERDTNVRGASGNLSNKSLTLDGLDKTKVHVGDLSDSSPSRQEREQQRNVMDGETDLETAQKNTPLYGQPAWWGDEQKRAHGIDGVDRPTSLAMDISQGTSAISPTNKPMGILLNNSSLSNVSNGNDPTHTPPERDTGPMAPANLQAQSTHALTSSQHSETGSAADESCKDPIFTEVASTESKTAESVRKDPKTAEAAPPPRRGSNMAFTIDLSDNKSDADDSSASGAPPTAFTIDFGPDEEKKPKKIDMNASLSQFLPKNVRKSFRNRVTKGKKSEDEDGQDQESETSQASEPTPKQWSSPATNRKSSLKQTTPILARKTGYLSDGAHSAMSSDNEDLSFRSDVVTTRSGRRTSGSLKAAKPSKTEVTFSLKSPEKPVSGGQNNSVSSYRNKPISASDSKMTRSGRLADSMSVEKKLERRIMRSKSAGIALNKSLNREASFDEGMSRGGNAVENHPPSEFALYKEAQIYDKMIKSHSAHTMDAITAKKPAAPESRPTRRSRKAKDNYARSRSVPRLVPTDDDNISEAGTYTIEPDTREIHKARRSIDAIFNVPGRTAVRNKKAAIANSTAVPTVAEHAPDINANFEGASPRHSDEVVQQDGRTYMQKSQHSGEVSIEISVDAPTGRSNVLSSSAPDSKLSGTVDYDKDSLFDTDRTSLSTNQKSRRKLPTPPGTKPELSPRSPRTGSIESALRDRLSDLETDPDSPGRQRGSVTIDDTDRGESFMVSFDAPQRTTPDMPRRGYGERDNVMVDDFFGVTTPPKTQQRRVRSKVDKPTAASSLRSSLKVQQRQEEVIDRQDSPVMDRIEDLIIDTPRNEDDMALDTCRSIDTQVLLGDTDQVMRALETGNASKAAESKLKTADYDVFNFEKFKRNDDLKLSLDQVSDSEASSTGMLLDDNRANRSTKPPRQPGQRTKPIGTKDRAMARSKSSHSDYYGVSDGHESEDTGSIASSGTDYSYGHHTSSPMGSRQNSVDKGRISNTRTNRAFALRRSKKEGGEETPMTSTSRSQNTTARTDVSLGTKIVAKSRDNQKVKRENTFTRKDGGRFSLREKKTNVTSSASAANTAKRVANAKPTADLSRPRAGRTGSASGPGNKAPSSSSKSSQPDNKGGVKKSEEHDLWKKRSKYDPRKAIKEAKAKEEEKRLRRARSAGNTPDFEGRSRSDTIDSASEDSFALGAESMNMSGIEDVDEITKLSSTVASDLSLLTASVQDEDEEFEQGVSFRSSAFTSVSHGIRNSAFSSPNKHLASNGGLINPVAVKASAGLTPESESYDPVLVASIYQMSAQIKSQTDKLLDRLKEQEGLHSPLDDLVTSHSANPELAATLQNLKGIEHSLKVVNSSLFPTSGESSPRDPEVHQQEMDRIRNELAGFKPIVNTKSTPSLLSSDKKLSTTKRDSSKYTSSVGSMSSLSKSTAGKTRTAYMSSKKYF